jgi:gamma-glutamyltranspeptidase/glutathione hydrolase/leukotriene-C4 hydrolase
MTKTPALLCGAWLCMALTRVMAAPKVVSGSDDPYANTQDTSGVKPDSEADTYRYMAATTGANICSTHGVDIMVRQGGSAVDGIIASFLCECIINSHHCGIGGGHTATVYEAPRGSTQKQINTVTSREAAPRAASRDMYVKNSDLSKIGGLAVGVPGEIHGFYEMWKIYGRVPWRNLFTEAIRLCEEGFEIEKSLAQAIATTFVKDPNLNELLINADGSRKKEGDIFINDKLGKTLRVIAEDPLSFYEGQLAEDIIADLQEHGSIITLKDLKDYSKRQVFKPPLKTKLSNGDYTLYNPPPPSSGAVLSFVLGILDGYHFTPDDIADVHKKSLTYHRIAEAFKFAYAKRSRLGDEKFIDIKDLIANLTSHEYAESTRAQIKDDQTQPVSYYGPDFGSLPEDSGTAHINVLAPGGGAVALTGTINTFFGAQIRGKRTGIIFNNEMDDFSTPGTSNSFGVPASASNYIVPGKMPMSSQCPTIAIDHEGRVIMTSGAAGGTRITTSTSFIMAHTLWLGLDLKEAVDAPRLHHQLVPNELKYEPGLEKEVVAELRARKHNTIEMIYGMSISQHIHNKCAAPTADDSTLQTEDCIEAVSDGRKGGTPDGF